MYFNEEFEEQLEGTNQTVSEAKEIVGEFEHKSAMQFRATSNYAQIYKLFRTDVLGNVYYPNEYSGAWIEGEDLYVALTDVSDEIINKYTSYLPFPENIKFAKMAKSLNELELEQSEYLSFFNANNIVTSYIDVKNNKCAFEVENISVDNAYSIIKNTMLSVDPKFPFSADSIVIKQGNLGILDTNIIGGMAARRTSGTFSVGVCGEIVMPSETIYDGFITCGHKKTISETIQINGNDFGKVCVLRFGDNKNGDFACVNMSSKTDTLTNKVYGSSSSTTRNITSSNDDVAEGTLVMKYGEESGYATGKVTKNNASKTVSVDDTTKVTINGLTLCSIESGQSTGGDSGGPNYIKGGEGNNYTFVGVHCGHNSSEFYFTPYVRFKSYFTPKTSV